MIRVSEPPLRRVPQWGDVQLITTPADLAPPCSSSTSRQTRRVKPRIEPTSRAAFTAETPDGDLAGNHRPLEKLPLEICIVIFGLVVAPIAHTTWNYNAQIEKLRQVCTRWRDVIDEARAFWLKITSKCPNRVNKAAIRKSKRSKEQGLPFSVQYMPHSLDAETSQKTLQEFAKFMKIVNPYKSQWKSLDIVLPWGGWETLSRYVTTPAHRLETLFLSMRTNDEPEQPGGSDVHHQLNLMGGAADHLEDVMLNNIPVHYNPAVFTSLSQLQLSNGVRISADEIVPFLRNAPRLQSLNLTDVASTGPFQSTTQEPIILPTLRSLILQDLRNPINMFGLFLSLHVPVCQYLHLALARDGGEAPEALNTALERLVARVSPVFQATSSPDSNLVSHIRLGDEDDKCEWWSVGPQPDGQPLGLRVALRLASEGGVDPMTGDFATSFCRFVKRVLDQTGRTPEIKVDILNRLRGVGPILQHTRSAD